MSRRLHVHRSTPLCELCKVEVVQRAPCHKVYTAARGELHQPQCPLPAHDEFSHQLVTTPENVRYRQQVPFWLLQMWAAVHKTASCTVTRHVHIQRISPVRPLCKAPQHPGPSFQVEEGFASEIDAVVVQIAAFQLIDTAVQGATDQPQNLPPVHGSS